MARSEVTSVHRTVGVGGIGSNCALTVDADSGDGKGTESSLSGRDRSTRNKAFFRKCDFVAVFVVCGNGEYPGDHIDFPQRAVRLWNIGGFTLQRGREFLLFLLFGEGFRGSLGWAYAMTPPRDRFDRAARMWGRPESKPENAPGAPASEIAAPAEGRLQPVSRPRPVTPHGFGFSTDDVW